jgi:hypothetical protein
MAAQTGGVVTNAVTGAPVPRAHLTMEGPAKYNVTAGADGRFSVTEIKPGLYSVAAEKTGFVASRRAERVEIKANIDKTDIDVKLTPTGAITGRVLDPDGEPVQGFSVMATPRYGQYATTNEKGEFRIGGLRPGRYRVMASHQDGTGERPEIRRDGTVEPHYARTWYPAVMAEKGAASIVVRAGAESSGADIRLVAVPFVRVSGKVIGIPPGTRGNLMIWQDNGGHGAALNADGSFELWRLDPGNYRLTGEWALANGEQTQTAPVSVDVAGSNIDGIELRVVADSDISGHLEFEDDQVKAAWAKVNGPRAVGLDAVNQFGGLESASVGENDTFHLDKVPAGKYRVTLSWDGVYVKSMRLGSATIDGAILDLGNGSGGGELSVTVGAANSSVSGTVSGGNATQVTLKGPDFVARSGPVKADGTYEFAGLAPGSYRIVATPLGEAVESYEDAMEDIEIGAGEKVVKDLKRQALDGQ